MLPSPEPAQGHSPTHGPPFGPCTKPLPQLRLQGLVVVELQDIGPLQLLDHIARQLLEEGALLGGPPLQQRPQGRPKLGATSL
eukprot:7655384-Alexandrium_andersonii.AAC.1